jgi:hypothetical protein
LPPATVLACKDEANELVLALVLNPGEATDVVAATPLGESYGFIERLHETDPASGASWTMPQPLISPRMTVLSNSGVATASAL